MQSALYEGCVVHRRSGPGVSHRFRFPLFMVYLDLAELDRVFRGRWLWSTRRPAFARFRRDDHLGDPRVPLDRAVRDLVEERSGVRPKGPIRLLTHLRYLGYAMNPVSLHYCFSPDGRRLDAVVADVTNTPWGERHAYVIARGAADAGDAALRGTAAKAHHVSPFLPMELDHRFRFEAPGERLVVRIEDLDREGRRRFDALLALRRRELDGAALARALVRWPAMTAQVIGGIHWQALRLWWKGAPFHPHPRASREALEDPT
jgi:hypothetical protein